MAIHATQDMIGEVLLKDEQNKKLLIRTQMDDSEVDFDSLTWDDEDDDRELVTLDYDWNDGNDNKVIFLVCPISIKLIRYFCRSQTMSIVDQIRQHRNRPLGWNLVRYHFLRKLKIRNRVNINCIRM